MKTPRKLPLPLSGIVPPIVTPLLEPDRLDVPGLERLVEHLVHGGVHGLFVLGTTGEATSLSYRLRFELVERVGALLRGRLPFVVGITDTAIIESLRLAEHAAGAGAAAVVLAPPYYIPPAQAEFLQYLGHLVPGLPLPLLLYNMPAMTKVTLEVDTVRQAAQMDGVIGIKDSSGDMAYFHRLIEVMRDRPDFSILMGSEVLIGEAVLFGAHGGVPGGGNVDPGLFVAMYEAARARRVDEIVALQRRIVELGALYRVGRYMSGGIKGIKTALSLKGICSDRLAEPFHHFESAEREKVRLILDRAKL